MGVPYDTTVSRLTEGFYEKLLSKEIEWDLNLQDMILKEKPSLFKGENHRFATLGHAPILGLIFGTGNIMSVGVPCDLFCEDSNKDLLRE